MKYENLPKAYWREQRLAVTALRLQPARHCVKKRMRLANRPKSWDQCAIRAGARGGGIVRSRRLRTDFSNSSSSSSSKQPINISVSSIGFRSLTVKCCQFVWQTGGRTDGRQEATCLVWLTIRGTSSTTTNCFASSVVSRRLDTLQARTRPQEHRYLAHLGRKL